MSSLASLSTVPIAQLSPHLETADTSTVHGIITLIWPYNSLTQSLSFLLVEPDFRLRRHQGQVRIHFLGSSAKALAKAGISSGDELSLSLQGALWEQDGETASTPGRGIAWKATFGERVLLESRHPGQALKVLNIDNPPPSPESTRDALSRPSSPIYNSHIPTRSRKPNFTASTDDYPTWSSPAFLKRNHSVLSSYDPFAELDDEFADNNRKKNTKFGHGNGQWKFVGTTPSPEREREDDTSPRPSSPSKAMQTETRQDNKKTAVLATPPIELAHPKIGEVSSDLGPSDPSCLNGEAVFNPANLDEMETEGLSATVVDTHGDHLPPFDNNQPVEVEDDATKTASSPKMTDENAADALSVKGLSDQTSSSVKSLRDRSPTSNLDNSESDRPARDSESDAFWSEPTSGFGTDGTAMSKINQATNVSPMANEIGRRWVEMQGRLKKSDAREPTATGTQSKTPIQLREESNLGISEVSLEPSNKLAAATPLDHTDLVPPADQDFEVVEEPETHLPDVKDGSEDASSEQVEKEDKDGTSLSQSTRQEDFAQATKEQPPPILDTATTDNRDEVDELFTTAVTTQPRPLTDEGRHVQENLSQGAIYESMSPDETKSSLASGDPNSDVESDQGQDELRRSLDSGKKMLKPSANDIIESPRHTDVIAEHENVAQEEVVVLSEESPSESESEGLEDAFDQKVARKEPVVLSDESESENSQDSFDQKSVQEEPVVLSEESKSEDLQDGYDAKVAQQKPVVLSEESVSGDLQDSFEQKKALADHTQTRTSFVEEDGRSKAERIHSSSADQVSHRAHFANALSEPTSESDSDIDMVDSDEPPNPILQISSTVDTLPSQRLLPSTIQDTFEDSSAARLVNAKDAQEMHISSQILIPPSSPIPQSSTLATFPAIENETTQTLDEIQIITDSVVQNLEESHLVNEQSSQDQLYETAASQQPAIIHDIRQDPMDTLGSEKLHEVAEIGTKLPSISQVPSQGSLAELDEEDLRPSRKEEIGDSSKGPSLITRLKEKRRRSDRTGGERLSSNSTSQWFTPRRPSLAVNGKVEESDTISSPSMQGKAIAAEAPTEDTSENIETRLSQSFIRSSPPQSPRSPSALPQESQYFPNSQQTTGFRTSLSYFVPVTSLHCHYGTSVDVLAVAISSTPITRATSGAKDHTQTIYFTDPSSTLSKTPNALTTAQIFRPYRSKKGSPDCFPSVQLGDVILLRDFKVQSFQKSLSLISTDSSAWAVFAKDAEVAIPGPPVEYGSEERAFAHALWDWWNSLDAAQTAVLKAAVPKPKATAVKKSPAKKGLGSDLSSSQPRKIVKKSESSNTDVSNPLHERSADVEGSSELDTKSHKGGKSDKAAPQRRVLRPRNARGKASVSPEKDDEPVVEEIHELRDGTRYVDREGMGVEEVEAANGVHDLRDGTRYRDRLRK